MANKIKQDKVYVVRVIPTSNDTYDEQFAIVNGLKVPFEVPVKLTERQIKILEAQKEPYSAKKKMNVFELMDKMKISQEKANALMRATDANEMGSEVKWRNKYVIKYDR